MKTYEAISHEGLWMCSHCGQYIKFKKSISENETHFTYKCGNHYVKVPKGNIKNE